MVGELVAVPIFAPTRLLPSADKPEETSFVPRSVNLFEQLRRRLAVSERRRHEHSRKFCTERLKIEVPAGYTPPVFRSAKSRSQESHVLSARLVDVSQEGLGLLTCIPLLVGSVVTVRGDLHSLDSCVEFLVRSQVVHCISQEDGSFRVGLSFVEEADYKDLPCEHEPGFTLSLDSEPTDTPDSELG